MSIDTDVVPAVERAEVACTVALTLLPGVGPATVLACHQGPGSAAVWELIVSGRGEHLAAIADVARRLPGSDGLARLTAAARSLDPELVLRRHELAGQRVVTIGQTGYPKRLIDDPSPPPVLFVIGSTVALAGPTVAIIGTRNATRLGRDTAAELARGLAARGVSIVSGLALGIDGAAHRALVGQGDAFADPDSGRPIGVIASGLDRPYPKRHELLHRQVATHGMLLSETPMGCAPLRWRFPARNRIIAGLADAVIVVESRSAGGSMLTAAEALIRDVPVLAVPGHPTSAAAAGPLDLICDGATPVRDVDDVLVAIGLGGRRPRERGVDGSDVGVRWGSDAQRVLDELTGTPRTLGELILSTSLSLEGIAEVLQELEGEGAVVRSGGWYESTGFVDRSLNRRAGR